MEGEGDTGEGKGGAHMGTGLEAPPYHYLSHSEENGVIGCFGLSAAL